MLQKKKRRKKEKKEEERREEREKRFPLCASSNGRRILVIRIKLRVEQRIYGVGRVDKSSRGNIEYELYPPLLEALPFFPGSGQEEPKW